MSNTVDLSDLDVIAAMANALNGRALQAATEAAAAPILAEAKRRAPVKSGEVRDALRITSHAGRASATSTVEVDHSGHGGIAHEAIFSEFGTAREAARPFMRPAFEIQKRTALANFSASLTLEMGTTK